MKNRWSLIWNPFTRIAGWQAFIAGLIFVALSGIAAKYADLAFDGAIDAHLGHEISFAESFIMISIDLFAIIVIMSVVGFVIAKQVRFVDIFGTMTLSRAPFLIVAILGIFVSPPDLSELSTEPIQIFDQPLFIVFSLLTTIILIWAIALMYNALKVSSGAKGIRLTAGFIIGLIVAEIMSKFLINIVFSQL